MPGCGTSVCKGREAHKATVCRARPPGVRAPLGTRSLVLWLALSGDQRLFFLKLNYQLHPVRLKLPKATLPDVGRHSCINKCPSPGSVCTVCAGPDGSQRDTSPEGPDGRCGGRALRPERRERSPPRLRTPCGRHQPPPPRPRRDIRWQNPRNRPRGRNRAGEDAEGGPGEGTCPRPLSWLSSEAGIQSQAHPTPKPKLLSPVQTSEGEPRLIQSL